MSANGREEMNCAAARDRFALLLYGELTFDEEERVESHLDVCADCRAALEREKALHAALDAVEVRPSPALLSRCREDLSELLHYDQRAQTQPGWWEQFASGFRIHWLRPAGAMALLAVGFFGAKIAPQFNFGGQSDYQAMGLLGNSRVRNVETQPDGRVRIVLDQTQQRTVSGTIDDQIIRALLEAAAKDPSDDPGLRAETVEILVPGAGSADVREALVFALENDQNAGVRLKAMDGLKTYSRDPAVQGALAQVLLRDANPGMRTQAIDLLAAGPGGELDRRVIGALQEAMGREDNAYVRERCQRMLELIRASSEIY
jgi:hypothetical protein